MILNYQFNFGTISYPIADMVKKLTDLRHTIAHNQNFNLENLVNYTVDINSIANKITNSDDTLQNNIYWNENILIPFIDTFSSEPNLDRYHISVIEIIYPMDDLKY